MATFATGCTDIDWLWGSLKPWQILHSTLAERERNGSALDVWELVNETLGTANYPSNSLAREEVHADRDHKEAMSDNWSWAQGMRFLGEDGEFWKPGGVMESRVREWLQRRLHDADDDAEEQELVHCNLAAAAETSPLASAHHHHYRPHQEYNYNSGSELAIAASSNSSSAPDVLQRHSHNSPSINSQLQLNIASADRSYAYIGVTAEDDDYQSSDTEGEHLEREAAEIGVHAQIAASQSAAAEDHDTDYRDNYALISANYEDGDRQYNGFSSRLVMNRYCSGATAGAADCGYHNGDLQFGGAPRSAAGGQLHLEEEIVEEVEVCAVCLEKLLNCGGDGDHEERSDAAVQALACRHLFHRACIAPWLQRQPHACCPCCRAPILAPPQLLLTAPPLHLAAPHHHPQALMRSSNCSGYHHDVNQAAAADPPHDIMGLLADMEAALERLGFRS